MTLTANDLQSFKDVASTLGIKDPNWLIDMIGFESGFDPKAKNPFSSARGLIQFIDSTARALGYTGSLDLVNQHPTIESQLEGPVTAYLRPYAPYNNEHELYMSVFLPIARRFPADTTFEQIYKTTYPTSWESKYSDFKKGNPNINTPTDYMNRVKKKPIIRVMAGAGLSIVGVALVYLIYRRFR